MNSRAVYSVLIALFFMSAVLCDVSHLDDLPVTDVCLGCICEASSGCNRTLTCNGEVCGLFRITWAYWADGGKPCQQGELPDSPTAYSNCVNEPFCAARTIQGYMKKFGKDCNRDNQINCYDYALIHKMGGYGCDGAVPIEYQSKFNECITYAQSQRPQ